MTPERWQQMEELYHAALELAPSARDAFLSQACLGDEELRREVESLLASHDSAASFIESSPDDVVAGMLAEEQPRSMIGRTLGHYRLSSLLGAGGMGEVYRACDLRLDRDVAVKILPEHLATDAEALRRFEREAKAVAALSHPNILSIFDFGSEAGISYAVMELLEGETLRGRLSRGAIDWREATEFGIAVAEGLSAAHAKNIIHRDLKPENIFLTSSGLSGGLTSGGGVKILDFGIARVKRVVKPDAATLTSASDTTRPGLVIGTIGYMSPEQVAGETAEATSDIFSLGCVLYEIVSGLRPFARETVTETIAAILRDAPPSLAAQTGNKKPVPEDFERVIRHCLEKKPQDRFQSARDLALELRATLTGTGQLSQPQKRTRQTFRPAVWLGAMLIVLLIGLAIWFYWAGRQGNVIDSLAILPLVNTSRDAEVDYLSDGITDSIINSLSQLPKLRVMARSTVFTYKDKTVDPRQVGQELKVRAVFTGRLTQRGDTLIIDAELVNAADGSRLWGERYSRKLSDVISMQTEIAKRISDMLSIKLSGEELQRLAKKPTDNSEAYQLYLKGRFHSNLLTIDGVKKGIELMNQAVALDPGYGLAYAGLADAYADASSIYLTTDEALPKARAAAEQALKLDETLAEAHTLLAYIKGNYDWKWEESEREFKRTIELRPSYARAHQAYGFHLMIRGRADEAIAEMTRAHDLDPLTNSLSATLAWFHYLTRRYDESIAQLQRLIKLDPTLPVGHYNLGMIYEQKELYEESFAAFGEALRLDPNNRFIEALLCHAYAKAGRFAEAQKRLAELTRHTQQNNLDPVLIGLIYSALGDKEQVFVWLEKAFRTRSENLLFLNVDPKYDSLRTDPRFTDMLRRLRLEGK